MHLQPVRKLAAIALLFEVIDHNPSGGLRARLSHVFQPSILDLIFLQLLHAQVEGRA